MKYNWEFWSIPKIALLDKNLSIEECMLLGILATMMNGENRAWPSQKTLSEKMRKSVRTVRYYSDQLEKHGWIDIERGKNNKIIDYKISIPPKPAKTADCNGLQASLQNPAELTPYTIYTKEHLKEHIVANATWGDKELTDYLNAIMNGKREDIKLIVEYWSLKGGIGLPHTNASIQFGSKVEIQNEITRHIKTANKLIKIYPKQRIQSIMDLLAENASFDWTLETVGKYIALAPQKVKESLQKIKNIHAKNIH
jgi:hypothetical protein